MKSDPTSLPAAGFVSIRPKRPYTVEEVAHMQALAVGGARSQRPVETQPATPIPPRPADDETVPLHALSGRYRGTSGSRELELRVDVDGVRPMQRLSGDFFETSGATKSYVGSFVITSPAISVSPTEAIIEGTGTFTIDTGSPRLRVTIPRVAEFASPAAAVAQFLTPDGIPGVQYTCAFESPSFRRIEFESDFVAGVSPFQSYDTGLLPSGGAARVLTIAAAFAEAGVEMMDTGPGDSVALSGAGSNETWSDSELHASMEEYFQIWKDDPGWRVWLLSATMHDLGPSLRGIMFDQQGAQRQGCAVFHDVIGGTSNSVVRAQLRTHVHELGHCFNLYHSHHKEYMQPPQPNRMDAKSWMHYPDYYQSSNGSGATAYWADFPFQFDDLEVVHLRHGFRNDVIMGGNSFGTGAAEIDPQLFADRIADGSGLRLHLRGATSFYLGEPLVVEIKLELTDLRGKRVNAQLHPKSGYVQIAIRKPGGNCVTYRPFIHQCAEPVLKTLTGSVPAIYESAFIGYGRDGLYFDNPGTYELRAIYHAVDGSKVMSNVMNVRVDAPIDKKERDIAELFIGDQQGKLLYLLGSDAPLLKSGNTAFEEVIAKHDDHPMAIYAKLVLGMNASRPFKSIDTVGRKVSSRRADHPHSAKLLTDVVDKTISANPSAKVAADAGLDNISLNMACCRLAHIHQQAGDQERATAVANRLVKHFSGPATAPFVQNQIKEQVAARLNGSHSRGEKGARDDEKHAKGDQGGRKGKNV